MQPGLLVILPVYLQEIAVPGMRLTLPWTVKLWRLAEQLDLIAQLELVIQGQSWSSWCMRLPS